VEENPSSAKLWTGDIAVYCIVQHNCGSGGCLGSAAEWVELGCGSGNGYTLVTITNPKVSVLDVSGDGVSVFGCYMCGVHTSELYLTQPKCLVRFRKTIVVWWFKISTCVT